MAGTFEHPKYFNSPEAIRIRRNLALLGTTRKEVAGILGMSPGVVSKASRGTGGVNTTTTVDIILQHFAAQTRECRN